MLQSPEGQQRLQTFFKLDAAQLQQWIQMQNGEAQP
jgi:hypothetical protein